MRIIPAVSLPVLLLASSAASAQTLVESAAAAAGGSAAGAAGKKVSEGLDSVFSKVAGAAKSAAAEGGRKGGRIAPAAPPIPSVRLSARDEAELASGGKVNKSAATSQPSSRQAKLEPGKAAVEAGSTPSDPPAPVAALPAPPSGPTLQDLQSLSTGASREQVVEKLGQPSSRISMSNDEGFVEIMKFHNQDGSVGSVRMVNGKVAEVKATQ